MLWIILTIAAPQIDHLVRRVFWRKIDLHSPLLRVLEQQASGRLWTGELIYITVGRRFNKLHWLQSLKFDISQICSNLGGNSKIRKYKVNRGKSSRSVLPGAGDFTIYKFWPFGSNRGTVNDRFYIGRTILGVVKTNQNQQSDLPSYEFSLL